MDEYRFGRKVGGETFSRGVVAGSALDNESRKSLYAVYKSAIESTDGSEIVIGKAMSLEKICEIVAWE